MELANVPLGFSDWLPHEKKVVLKVTLVRHGETVANRDRIVQGQTPGMLTEFGREQERTHQQYLFARFVLLFVFMFGGSQVGPSAMTCLQWCFNWLLVQSKKRTVIS